MSNPITVELPADLPTDWQQYQVVSPNGTEAGLDEQHGYNYLMEQVNNAQTAAKECGEALGDTVPASREINGHPLTDDVDLNAADVGAAERNFLELSRYGTHSTGYTGWIEVGRIPIVTTSNSTQSIVFLVLGNQNTKNGILSLLIRIEPKATISATLSNLEWLSVSDEDLVNKFALASEDGYAVLYAKVTSTWDFFHVGILGQAFDTNEFMDPSDSRLFKLTSNWNLEGNHKETINPILTSSIGFTPEIMGAAAASGWVNGRLFVGSSSGGITQLGFPSSAGSVLRSGTGGGPYWTSIADLIAAMGAVRIKCGTYTGNGEYDSESSYTSNPQTINLGLKPKAVLVMSETGGMDSGSGWYYGGLVWDGSDLVVFLDTNFGDINAKVITLTNSGFTVYAQRVRMSSSSYRYIATNEDGLKYRYIVFY